VRSTNKAFQDDITESMVKAIVPQGLSAVRVYSTSKLLCIVLSIT